MIASSRLTKEERKQQEEEKKKEKERKRLEKEREKEKKKKDEIRIKNRTKGIKLFKVCLTCVLNGCYVHMYV